MGRVLWLPDKLREYGVQTSLVDGWMTRGAGTLEPQVVIAHHDAIPGPATAPGLRLVTVGRSDLPGPLCQVYLGRDGVAYVVASGKANHAGEGGWHGYSGNTEALGIEAANDGVGEPWPLVQLDAYYKIVAAMLDGMGFKGDESRTCGHKEWAPTRKIDPRGIDMNDFRAKVNAVWTPPVVINPPAYTGTLEENTVRATVDVATGADGKGWVNLAKPWAQYRGVSAQGFDPPYMGAYLNPVVTAHNVNDQIRIVVTGWLPNSKVTTHVNLSTV